MLSPTRIEQMISTEDHDRLVNDLADNGMELPEALRGRLANATVAYSLGLRRLTELTYGPTPLRQRMTSALVNRQLDDGGFASHAESTAQVKPENGPGQADGSTRLATSRSDTGTTLESLHLADYEADPLTTAAAAAALDRVLADQPASTMRPGYHQARDRALDWLAKAQQDDGSIAWSDHQTLEDQALGCAFIVYLLAESPAFRQKVRTDELMAWLRNHLSALSKPATRLWHMARLTLTSHAPARDNTLPNAPMAA